MYDPYFYSQNIKINGKNQNSATVPYLAKYGTNRKKYIKLFMPWPHAECEKIDNPMA